MSAISVGGLLTSQIDNGAADTLPLPDGQDAVIVAHVAREGGLRRNESGEFQQRLDLEMEEVAAESWVQKLHFGVRATFYGKQNGPEGEPASIPQFHYGQRLRFLTTLSRPQNFGDPGAFDYRGYLAQNGIVALASAKTANVEILPGFAGSRLELWRTQIRNGILQRIHQLWQAQSVALVDAMLMGDNALLGRDLLADFQRTGTYHVLVISGLKVGILAWMTFWLLRQFRVGDLTASAVAVVLTVLYALLTDVGVPVWRATLMLALYLCARALYRRKAVLNTIGAAGLALLLIDPAALSGASFQLSFLCVLIIAAIASPILDRTTRPLTSALNQLEATGCDFALPASLVQLRLDLRLIGSRMQRFPGGRVAYRLLPITGRALLLSCEFLITSAALQIGFALPMAYYFHRATLVALPANVLAVPLTEIALVACVMALALSYISLGVARLPVWIASLSLQALAGSVRWMGGLRIADTRVATPGVVIILLSAAALILAMLLARRRALLTAAGLIVLAACATWISRVPPHPQIQPGVLEVTAIDVGEGDAILLVSPHGRSLLVDAGGIPHWMHSELDIGEDVVSPYLWSRGIERLEAVAVTHPHADHIGGMKAVMANFHPHELWIGAGPPTFEMEQLLKEATRLAVPVVERRAGDRWASGDLTFHALAPAAAAEVHSTKTNDDSLVMAVADGASTVLLEGDAEKATERRMVSEQPAADLLKVAHHGSATSTIPELLAAVHPRYAVISVGRHNVYGHPRQEVLARLENSHVKTYRTDLDGAVTFYLEGGAVTARVASRR